MTRFTKATLALGALVMGALIAGADRTQAAGPAQPALDAQVATDEGQARVQTVAHRHYRRYYGGYYPTYRYYSHYPSYGGYYGGYYPRSYHYHSYPRYYGGYGHHHGHHHHHHGHHHGHGVHFHFGF
jgi:hypothetical protein